jgi:hypothetical protein
MDLTPEQWERIKALFEAALQQPPAKRASFLARLCPEARLRAEVEKLLANHDEAGSFLSDPILGKAVPARDSAARDAFATRRRGFFAFQDRPVAGPRRHGRDLRSRRHQAASPGGLEVST